MTIFRGLVGKVGTDTHAETVVVTGLCCAVPFQVVQLNAVWFEVEYNNPNQLASKIRISVQSVIGHQPLESTSLLAVRSMQTTTGELYADVAQVILPVQSTTGDIIVRLETDYVDGIVNAHFVMDLSFTTLKELDYMRLVASGY